MRSYFLEQKDTLGILHVHASNANAMREKFLDVWFSPVAQRAIEEARNELLAKRQKQQRLLGEGFLDTEAIPI